MPETTPSTSTFLFTDIEGSTQLLTSHRGEYAAILAAHHRLLRDAFAAHGGREIDNQGDAFFVAFARAWDTVLAAAACQRALAAHVWPGGRAGSGADGDPHGRSRCGGRSLRRPLSASGREDLPRRARRQVLVSQTTASLLEDDEDALPGIALKDLGEHRLKDIGRPVRLFQLEIDGLRTTFPRLAATDPAKRERLKRAALAGVVLVAAAAAGIFALLSRDPPPPDVLPNRLVTIDPRTFEPTDVVPVGDAPDLVVAPEASSGSRTMSCETSAPTTSAMPAIGG